MQTIDIKTTHNVIINYELALLQQRIIAFIIDFAIIFFSVFLSITMGMIAFGEYNLQYVVYFLAMPIFFFYTPILEIYNDGQTIGKKALKIKIVKLDGKEPQLSDYLLRWVFRIVDIYFTAGTLATLMIGSSSQNQRLGDILANTTLIQVKPKMDLQLSDILKLNNLSTYQPQYPEIRKLNEEDMVLTKTVLELAARHPNKAHQEAIALLANQFKQKLGILEYKTTHVTFLNTLLKDYITVTR